MYQALYRSYRPETFDELIGQDQVKKILTNQLASGTTGHAYLFCGTRGTGKTTTARLLAKGLNCSSEGIRPCGKCPNCRSIAEGNFVDVLEMDAASNRGVDDIRDLREEVNFPPIMGRCKVYIMDEVHMLTKEATNAFLKTLEEPPEKVVFILATTEPEKLPATIRSRCMRLDFRRVDEKLMVELFERICRQSGLNVSRDALALIAANADGSVRDGLSILDRCSSLPGEVGRDDVLDLLGAVGINSYLKITDEVLSSNTGAALLSFADALSEGTDVRRFCADWIEHFRNLMIVKFSDEPQNMLNLSVENIDRLRDQASRISSGKIRECIIRLSETLSESRWSPYPRVLVELAIVLMSSADERADSSAPPPVKEEERSSEKSAKRDKTPKKGSGSGEILWLRVMGDDRVPPMFRLADTSFVHMSEHEFTVRAGDSVIEALLGNNSQTLEELLKEYGGRELRLKVIRQE